MVVEELTDPEVRVPRKGTSIHNFLVRFGTPEVCLQHVFAARFGPNPVCIQCGGATKWYRIRKLKCYASNCCKGCQIFPLTGTVFSRSSIRLDKWFYAILHFCNASSGISSRFLADHLGISRKAAFRMAERIRGHLQALDDHIRLGGPGKIVYIDETVLHGIRGNGLRSRTSLRILAACDDDSSLIIPVRKGRFASSAIELFDRIAPGSIAEFRYDETLRKVCHHRVRKSIRGSSVRLSDNDQHMKFHKISVMLIAMKNFIMKNHISVSSNHIDKYIGHFMFIYRRRHSGGTIFDEALEHFPILS